MQMNTQLRQYLTTTAIPMNTSRTMADISGATGASISPCSPSGCLKNN